MLRRRRRQRQPPGHLRKRLLGQVQIQQQNVTQPRTTLFLRHRRSRHQESALPRTAQLPTHERGAAQDARALRQPELLQRRDEDRRRGQEQEKGKV